MAVTTWKGTDSTSPTDFNTAANWTNGSPSAGDTIIFSPAYDNPCTENVDQGTTAYAEILVEQGFTSDIGSADVYLTASPTDFSYHGSGRIYMDFGTSSGIDPVISSSASYALGTYAIHLKGDIDVLSITGGAVAIAYHAGDSASISTASVSKGRLHVSSQTSSFSALTQTGGTVTTNQSVGTVKLLKGSFATGEDAGISTSLTAYSGSATLNGTGTYASIQIEDQANVNMTNSGRARTITTLAQNGGHFFYDPSVITIGTDTAPNRIVQRVISNV